MVAFRLLGPMEIRDPGGQLVIPPRRKQRALLALLLLRSGTVVGSDEIMDALWGERPPASARANLYSYVSGLRHILARACPAAEPRPQSTASGYRLDVRPEEYDALAFERLAAAGRRALAEGRAAAAADSLARALGLWRGAALEGLEPYDWLVPHAARLEEARLAALEDQIEARLLLDQHADLAVELAATTRRHPLRERLWGLFMTALHRSGRTADALRAYNDFADALEAELGATPGAALRELHRQLRGGGSAPRPRPAPAPSVPAAAVQVRPALLPPDIADFTGRRAEVEHLSTLLGGGAPATTPTVLPVVGVGGMAGVGKTTLAVHIAHRVAPSYPDGQLYINLRGAETSPVDSADALARFLRALGVDSRAIPPDTAGRTGLYRTRLAGHRILVVLDNAASEEQVRPLLPGAATCAVLVTSRRRLTGIEGVRWTDLEVFDRTEAVRLLAGVTDDDRVAGQPDDAAEIVRLCGSLPLAVRIAGARLVARPSWRLAHLVRRLSDERGRLDGLAAGDLGVRASLGLSYDALEPPTQRLFRLLGLFDLADFPAWLAAAVLDSPLPDATDHLEALVDARLLGVTGPDPAGQARYRFHDLVRLFAREHAETGESEDARAGALSRGFGAWLAIAQRMAADVPGPCYAAIGGLAPRPSIDWADSEVMGIDALRWFDAERAQLVSVTHQACRLAMSEVAFDVAGCLEKYFDTRGMYTDWKRLNARVMAVCREAGNLRGEAVMLRGLIDVTTWSGDPHPGDAMSRSKLSAGRLLEMFTELNDRRGMSDAAVMCTWGLAAQGRHEDAVALGLKALRLAEESDHPGGQVRARIAIAVAYAERERWETSVTHLTRGLSVARGLRNARCEATVLQFLGIGHREMGDFATSERELERSLAISRGYDDRYAEAFTMIALAGLRLRQGDPGARDAAETALALGREYRMSHHVADALGILGEIELAEGRPDRAVELLEESVALWRTRGWLSFLAAALAALGRAYASIDKDSAEDAFAEARVLYKRLGNDAKLALIEASPKSS